MNDLFKDLIVVELANVLAGPMVGTFFAELGARVIKVENPKTGGDITRHWKLPGEDPAQPDSAYYHSANYGKTSLFLDLEAPADREQVYTWIRKADVVVSNFPPAAAHRLGIDRPTLARLNPRLVLAQLTSFIADPGRPAFDVLLQAETGFLYMNGAPGHPPVKMPVALIDLLAAHQLKEGILLALIRRGRDGRGQYVSTSLEAAALSSLANQATNWLMAGHIPQPMGMQHPNIAPYGDLLTGSDQQQVVLAVGTDRHFEALCLSLGQEHLAQDARFATNDQRVIHRIPLMEHLQKQAATYTGDDLIDRLRSHRVPAARINNLKEVFEQPTAQSMVLSMTHPGGKVSRRIQTLALTLEPLTGMP